MQPYSDASNDPWHNTPIPIAQTFSPDVPPHPLCVYTKPSSANHNQQTSSDK